MPDLSRARDDLGAFADMAGHRLAPWQLPALALEALVTVIVAPRQSGKTRALVLLALWWCLRKPGQRVTLVAASEESGKRGLRMGEAIVDGAPDLLAGSVVDRQAARITFTNGSMFTVVPLSEAAIRGATNDLLLLDEAALHSEAIIGAAMPTVAARVETGARVVMASSATVASGQFFDQAVRGERGEEGVRTFRWKLEDATWISPSWLAQQRASMTPSRFAAEYLGEFSGSADSLFTRDLLDAVTLDFEFPDLTEQDGRARLVAGCDPGATHDPTALAAVGRLALPDGQRIFALVGSRKWQQGAPLSTGRADVPGVCEEIAQLPCAWDTFVAERNGVGEALCGPGGILWRLLSQRSAHVGGANPPTGMRLLVEPMTRREEEEEERRKKRIRVQADAGQFATRRVGLTFPPRVWRRRTPPSTSSSPGASLSLAPATRRC